VFAQNYAGKIHQENKLGLDAAQVQKVEIREKTK
jgi:hypothetical protein